MKKLYLMGGLASLALSVACVASPVAAQSQNCAPRDMVVQRLAERYGESRQAIGMGQQGMVMETFASNETGSWTITVTTPHGITCLVASGEAYESLNEVLPEPEDEGL